MVSCTFIKNNELKRIAIVTLILDQHCPFHICWRFGLLIVRMKVVVSGADCWCVIYGEKQQLMCKFLGPFKVLINH